LAWESCRSAVSYTSVTRQLLLRLKHGRDYSVAPLLAQWMWTLHASWIQEVDYLCGIPLYWTRHLKRRFNQADLLAYHLSRLSGVAILPAWVWKRHKKTASQGHLSPEARWNNVSQSFLLHPRASQILQGKTLLLIDDVMTTGATFRACSEVLRDSGAHIRAMSVARVVPEKICRDKDWVLSGSEML